MADAVQSEPPPTPRSSTRSRAGLESGLMQLDMTSPARRPRAIMATSPARPPVINFAPTSPVVDTDSGNPADPESPTDVGSGDESPCRNAVARKRSFARKRRWTIMSDSSSERHDDNADDDGDDESDDEDNASDNTIGNGGDIAPVESATEREQTPIEIVDLTNVPASSSSSSCDLEEFLSAEEDEGDDDG
jgi:hypothetical protein